MKRAVMTGGRKWPFHHRPEMRASLLMFRRAGIERLGQGEARGADRLAAELWRQAAPISHGGARSEPIC